ncbi:MAG: GumC family protein [Allorhizobium sp.]
MAGVNNSQQDVDIDLGQLFLAVWRNRARILVATGVVGALAFVGASLVSPTYRSETRILIEARTPNFSSQGTTVAAEAGPVFDDLDIVSQVQLLRSVDLIKQVARDMKLFDLKEFDPDTSPSVLSDILVLVGLAKNPLDLPPEERVIKAFQEKLEVYQVEKSRVIGIEFTSEDPKLAAAIPNAMAKVYLSLQSGAKLDSNSEAARWLEPEIANLREKVEGAEKKVADYRSKSDLFSANGTDSFATQQLNDISAELTKVRGEKADAEAKAENVRSALAAGKPTDVLDAVLSSPVVQRLKESETTTQAQLNDLSTTLLDGHPRLKSLRAQLAGIRQQIASESRRVADSLASQANVARLKEAQLEQQLNVLKSNSARAGEDEVGLKALEREAVAQRQLLETYLARYREATTRLEKAASPADGRIISTAIEPQEAHFPKVLPITIVAALATLVLSAIIVMLTELFSGRALRPVNAQEPRFEEEEAAAVAEQAPPPRLAQRRPVNDYDIPASMLDVEPDSELAEEMELAVSAPPEDKGSEVGVEPENDFSIQAVAGYLIDARVRIAIAISPSGDDGSTATVMLARELAEAGRRVILVDMTGSACPTRLMAARQDLAGITDLLCGEAAFSETIHSDRLSSADIVPQGNCDIRQAMRGADRLAMITDALADVYDVVVVECGPANAEGVARLSRNGDHEIILSAPHPEETDLAGIMAAFEKAGYADLVLMSGLRLPERDVKNRSAA